MTARPNFSIVMKEMVMVVKEITLEIDMVLGLSNSAFFVIVAEAIIMIPSI